MDPESTASVTAETCSVLEAFFTLWRLEESAAEAANACAHVEDGGAC